VNAPGPRLLCACLCAAWAGGVWLGEPSAHAQPGGGEVGKRQAAELIGRAQRACTGGDHDRALAALKAAFQKYPHARIGYRTGVEQQHLGQLAEAMESLESYLSEPEREPEYVADAVSRINQIRPSLGAVDVLAEPGGLVVVDGRPRGRTPLHRVRLTAGPHQVTVSRDGFSPFQTTVEVAAGKTVAIPAVLAPQATVAEAPGPAPAPASDPGLAAAAPAAPGRPLIDLALLFGGGVWTSGIGETATTLGLALGGSYRLTGDGLSFHLGPRLTVNTIGDRDRTVYATGFMAAPQLRLVLVPARVQVSFELGGGLMVLWGLRAPSMLLVPRSGDATGGLSAVALRPALTFEYQLGPEVALVTGMAAIWSPRPDPAFRERYLVHIDFALGLSWAL
jgi:hypothetical protein